MKKLFAYCYIFLLINHGTSLEPIVTSQEEDSQIKSEEETHDQKNESEVTKALSARQNLDEAEINTLHEPNQNQSPSLLDNQDSNTTLDSSREMVDDYNIQDTAQLVTSAGKSLTEVDKAVTSIVSAETALELSGALTAFTGIGIALLVIGAAISIVAVFFPAESDLSILLDRINMLDLKITTKLDVILEEIALNDAKEPYQELESLNQIANNYLKDYINAQQTGKDPAYVNAAKEQYLEATEKLSNGFSLLTNLFDTDQASQSLFSTPFWPAFARSTVSYQEHNHMIKGLALLAAQILAHLSFYWHTKQDFWRAQITKDNYVNLQNLMISELSKINDIRKDAAADYIRSSELQLVISECGKFEKKDVSAKVDCVSRLSNLLISRYYDILYTTVVCYNQLNGYENNSRRYYSEGLGYCHENIKDRKCCIILYPRECEFYPVSAPIQQSVVDALMQFDQNHHDNDDPSIAEQILDSLDRSINPAVFIRSVYNALQTEIPYFWSAEQNGWYGFATQDSC